jgi:cytochrome c oxidase subunit 4
VDLGELNIYIALGIAAVKASIVALYFMHLRYDRPFNGLILVTAFLFVALFVGAVMDDTHAYRDNLGEPGPIRSQGP